MKSEGLRTRFDVIRLTLPPKSTFPAMHLYFEADFRKTGVSLVFVSCLFLIVSCAVKPTREVKFDADGTRLQQLVCNRRWRADTNAASDRRPRETARG